MSPKQIPNVRTSRLRWQQEPPRSARQRAVTRRRCESPVAATRAGRARIVAIVAALGACAVIVAILSWGLHPPTQGDALAPSPIAPLSSGSEEEPRPATPAPAAPAPAAPAAEPPVAHAEPEVTLEPTRSALTAPELVPTRLDGVVGSFHSQRPDPIALQNELRRIVASARLLPETVRTAKDGTVHGELDLPDLSTRATFLIRGASYRIELPILEHLEAELADRQLTLNFVEIDGAAQGVIVNLRGRPRAGEAFDAYLEARGGVVPLGWQLLFSERGIKASQTGAVRGAMDGGPATRVRNTGSNVTTEYPVASDPTVFDAWLAALRAARL